MRTLVTSVHISDCEVQTFRAGGKGGQNQNKRDTGVRVIHHPSGARGEARDERSQLQNKKAAFRRMALSWQFRRWAMGLIMVDPRPEDVKVEYWQGGEWVES